MVLQENSKEILYGSINAGLFIDAGLNFKTIDTQNLMVFLRLKRDITPAYTGKGREEYNPVSEIKNMSLSLNAAYGFQIRDGSKETKETKRKEEADTRKDSSITVADARLSFAQT